MNDLTTNELVMLFREGLVSKQEVRDSLGFAGAIDSTPVEDDGDPSVPAPLPNTVPAPVVQQTPAMVPPPTATPFVTAQRTIPNCPIHHVPAHLKPAGTSKTSGKHFNAFWNCTEKMEDGSWCKWTQNT